MAFDIVALPIEYCCLLMQRSEMTKLPQCHSVMISQSSIFNLDRTNVNGLIVFELV
jgi:hypothetical protein